MWFAEVERLYPYSDWAKRALIMQAFAYHRTATTRTARAAAQRYIDFYPADEDAAYAQYLLALSYYDQIDEVGRDQGLTFQALQALRTVIERYPDSEYARSAMLKFDLAFDHLAAKEMEIGRYYLKRKHYTAGDQPVPRGGRGFPDHHPHARGAAPAGRGLSVAGPCQRGADRRRDPGLQLPSTEWYRTASRC
jgi:outer membrane assembly lipoprotein YfiO